MIKDYVRQTIGDGMKNLIHIHSDNWWGRQFADTEGEDPPTTTPPPDGGPFGSPEPTVHTTKILQPA